MRLAKRVLYLVSITIKVMYKFLLGTCLLAGATLSTQAQVSKFSGCYGTGVVLVKGSAPEVEEPTFISSGPMNELYVLKKVNSAAIHLSVSLGFDAPLYKFNPEHSVGVSLNASAGILGAPEQIDGFNKSLLLDFPEYLTWRYGAKATKKSQKSFGVGAGIGYRASYFFLPFHSPNAMLEGVYSSSKADWFLRLTGDLQPTRFYNLYSSEGPVEVLSLQELHVVAGCSF